MNSSIWRKTTKTKDGNHLSVCFNKSINLLVVDVFHGNESGGNEILRMTLNEEWLLAHCQPYQKRRNRSRRKERIL
ncbi:MAG: hypothetical protein O2960_29625 [Verrucomicrobia bacterium]|nr:hypothetical protein [Verrucomicrobiota bacterium]